MRRLPKETVYKLIIAGGTIIVCLLLTAVLIITGIVKFSWTERLQAKWNYDQSKAKAKRILVLGDSQLSWWNLDHCLYEDLRRFCNEHHIGYVSSAKGGFGPIEYEDRMQAISPDYQPHLILLFYYAGNDLTDVLYRSSQRPKKSNFEWVKQLDFTDETFAEARKINPFSTDAPKLQAGQKEQILRNYDFDWETFKRKGVDSTIISYAQNRLYYPGKIGPEYVNPHLLVMGTWRPNYLYDNLAMRSPKSQACWQTIKQRLDNILSMAKAIDAQLKIVIIPATAQVDESHHDFYRKITFAVDEDLTSARAPQDYLSKWAAKSNVQCTDLLAPFKAHPQSHELYFENDDHLSEIGHQEAFKHLKREILQPWIQQ